MPCVGALLGAGLYKGCVIHENNAGNDGGEPEPTDDEDAPLLEPSHEEASASLTHKIFDGRPPSWARDIEADAVVNP